MALPVVKSLLDCTNFTNTVEPYLYQLRPLPQIVFESITNPFALKQVYVDTNPFISALGFALALAPLFLVAAEINQNYSQVDRFWSILPTVYNVHYAVWAHLAGYDTGKQDLVAIASILWSMRLTYNYYRRGGYSIGSEDYRWAILKDYIGQPWFFIFDILFIAFYQMILLFAVTMPTYVLLLTSRLATAQNVSAATTGDRIAFGTMVSFIVLSAVSDQQQWNFQNAKHEYYRTGKIPAGTEYTAEEFDRGFLTKKFFAFTRHPNFTSEQSVWLTLYLWSLYATGQPYHWAGVGTAAYLALFQGSTWLTELLSAQKYPAYKVYQKQIPMFLPYRGGSPPVFTKSAKQIANEAAKEKDAQVARQRYDLR